MISDFLYTSVVFLGLQYNCDLVHVLHVIKLLKGLAQMGSKTLL